MNLAHLLDATKIGNFDTPQKMYKVTAFSFEDDLKHFYRIFEKEVTLELEAHNRWLIHFGGPISYTVQDLIQHWRPANVTNFNSQLFCIDAAGLNHGITKSVYVTKNCVLNLMAIIVARGNMRYPHSQVWLDRLY